MTFQGARMAMGGALGLLGVWGGLALGAGAVAASPGDAAAQDRGGPEAAYRVLVANESSDLVSVVRFGPEGAVLERDFEVGIMPADLDGAHGLTVSPDGRSFYVSLAHGTPFGRLWRMDPESGAVIDSTSLGRFPATIGITPDGSRAFVVNFNLHGDPVPSTVSTVFTPAMVEEKQVETCVKPHGSRVNHAGTRHYSVCVGSDELVEISVERVAVRRRMDLTPGAEMALTAAGEPAGGASPEGAPAEGEPVGREPGGGTRAAAAAGTGKAAACGPTWVIPSHDDARLYVACNKNDEVLEVDAETLEVTRRFHGGEAPYNLAATSDGRLLLATNKGGQSVSVFDLASGEELARIEATRPVTHGVTISHDDRYAFVSNEAVGATRGTVDVIDLERLERVASTEVHHQPGGIDFWRMEAAGR